MSALEIIKSRLTKEEGGPFEIFCYHGRIITVLGELYYGALKSVRIDDNLKRVNDFATGCTILTCDAETAEEYGRIKAELSRKGKMVPENDIWIAAVTRQYDLTRAQIPMSISPPRR